MRTLRIIAAFLLTPFVLLMILVASLLPEGRWQEASLVAAVLGVVIIVSAVALPEDAKDDYEAAKRFVGRNRTWTAVVSVLAGALAVWLFDAVLRERVPGKSWAGLAVQLSLPLWIFAVLAYQSRRVVPRRPFVSVVVGLADAAVVLLLPVAYLSLSDEPLDWWVALVILLILPTAAFLGLFVLSRTATRLSPTPSTPPPGSLAIIGVGLAIVSSVLLLGSVIRVPLERKLLETSQVAERGAGVGPLALREPGSLTPEERRVVLERFAPVLRLHDGDWLAYDASRALAAVVPPPVQDCADRLREPCSDVILEPIRNTLPDSKPPEKERVVPKGVVYPKLHDVVGATRELGDRVPVWAREARWLIQYWLFYPYNDWEARTAVGTLVQKHGGDWEWVAVAVDRRAAPLYVAYSAHCTGTWRPWSEAASVAVDGRRVLVGGSKKDPASHPLVIVADGSHANYATPGTREPDWTSCTKASGFGPALRWLTFVLAAREETPDLGPFQVPDVAREAETDDIAQRPLWWGDGGSEQLARIRLGSSDHGPPSPVYQQPWKNPTEVIFGTSWDCDAGVGCTPRGDADTG
jgi:hypothetical protein